jgi:hypothetical protein
MHIHAGRLKGTSLKCTQLRSEKLARGLSLPLSSKLQMAPWMDGFLFELSAFPRGKFDDWLDSWTQPVRR